MNTEAGNALYHDTDFERAHQEEPVDGALPTEPYRHTFRRDYARLIHSTSFRRLKGKMQLFPDAEGDYYRNRLTSHLVGEFVRAVQVKPSDGFDPVFAEIHLDRDVWIKIETLKHLTFHFLIHSPRWKVVAWRSREIVKYLFDTLTADKGHELMPDDCKQLYGLCGTDRERKRVVCDFIACMTDTYAVEFYSRLQSDRPSSFFKPL